MAKYVQIYDDEWVDVTARGHKSMCCDCCLVHVMDFRKDKDGGFQVRVRRDNRATAAARRGAQARKALSAIVRPAKEL